MLSKKIKLSKMIYEKDHIVFLIYYSTILISDHLIHEKDQIVKNAL